MIRGAFFFEVKPLQFIEIQDGWAGVDGESLGTINDEFSQSLVSFLGPCMDTLSGSKQASLPQKNCT